MQEFELWPQGPIFNPGAAFPLGTDSVLLSDFARTAGVKRGCELCCGSGAVSLMLLWRAKNLHMDCVELLPEAASAARGNFAKNNLQARSSVINGDIREIRSLLPAGSQELVVCNPPYFAEGSGKLPADPERSLARSELGCSISEVCAAAGWLLTTGGSFCLVFRPERLSELFHALTAAGLEPKRLQTVSHTIERAPSLVLVEARRGSRPGLTFMPPLWLYEPDGAESGQYKRIYHKEAD